MNKMLYRVSDGELSSKVLPTDLDIDGTSAEDYPGDLCCSLYDKNYWQGDNITLCLDDANTAQHWDLKQVHFNDEMASWNCGKSVRYEFCFNEEDCTGLAARKGGESGAGTISAPQSGRHDWFTSLWMWPYDPLVQGAVTLYEYQGCKGCSAYFLASTIKDEKVQYTEDDMYHDFMWNDKVSSMMIPKGYAVRLWENDGFSGSYRDYSKDIWFTDEYEDMVCINVTGDFDNKTSSIEVWKTF